MGAPRPGGETAKFGERYEGVWTVRQVLEVLQGNFDRIVVEPIKEELGRGAEFALTKTDGATEVHQVKRQLAGASDWSLSVLGERGVLASARHHVESGRGFRFVSTIPARQLSDLSDRARRTSSLEEFENEMLGSKDYSPAFTYLSREAVWGSRDKAWNILRWVSASWPDERELRSSNAALCERYFETDSPRSIPAVLAEFLLYHTGTELRASSLYAALAEQYGLKPRAADSAEEISTLISKATDRWEESVRSGLLQSVIDRQETQELLAAMSDDDSHAQRAVMLSGDAGQGKSAVLLQAVGQLREDGRDRVLAFRLDRLDLTAISSTLQLGHALDLDISPVSALAAVAQGEKCAIVIDQLDAISLVSGRAAQAVDVISELYREASAFPNVVFIFACRQFDLRNDHRFRQLLSSQQQSREIKLAPLTDAQVRVAVRNFGLYPERFTPSQRTLLQNPLNLVLLSAVASDLEAMSFSTTKNLFDLYWKRKQQECRDAGVDPDRFVLITFSLAKRMSERQRLSMPRSSVAEGLQLDAEKLVSANILTLEEGRWAFFHESFFDYVFAKNWLESSELLVDFLSRGDQELFRRAQVRQVLAQLRYDDRDRYLDEVKQLLESTVVRFHIKDLVFALFAAEQSPSAADWAVLRTVLSRDDERRPAALKAICTPAWMVYLTDAGVLSQWLNGSSETSRSDALTIMRAGIRQEPGSAAPLMQEVRDHPDYLNWMYWLIPPSDLSADRAWFELAVDVFRTSSTAERDSRGLWVASYDLVERNSSWAAELLGAIFSEGGIAEQLDEGGRVRLLKSHEHLLMQFISAVAEAEPQAVQDTLLPYVLRISALTSHDSKEVPVRDRHFSYIEYGGSVHEVEDAVWKALLASVVEVCKNDPVIRDRVVEELRGSEYYSAQFLLYSVLASAPLFEAERAVSILSERASRFDSGYLSDAVWQARELVSAIESELSDSSFRELENAILRFDSEYTDGSRPSYTVFELLSALSVGRLSNAGQELLRQAKERFEVDVPEPPAPIVASFVGPPIDYATASAMTDAEWLDAIHSYTDDIQDRVVFDRGGARELASLFARLAKVEPERFIELLSGLPGDANPEYAAATLRALADDDVELDASLLFTFVENCAARGDSHLDRWLGMPIRKFARNDIPASTVIALAERARRSEDPEPGKRVFLSEDVGSLERDVLGAEGINCARGSLAEVLAILVDFDPTASQRAQLLQPFLADLCADPSLAVRSCVAELVKAFLRYDEDFAVQAFTQLLATDIEIASSNSVAELLSYVGQLQYQAVGGVLTQMLSSDTPRVAFNGGVLAAFFGLEFNHSTLLDDASASLSAAVRGGVARTCAARLTRTANRLACAEVLTRLFSDADGSVRAAACEVVATLRDADLRPFEDVLAALIRSESFNDAQGQLWITLERAQDSADHLILLAVKTFLERNRKEVSDLTTRAAGDARHVTELVLQVYAQSTEAPERSSSLDLIDALLLAQALDVKSALGAMER